MQEKLLPPHIVLCIVSKQILSFLFVFNMQGGFKSLILFMCIVTKQERYLSCLVFNAQRLLPPHIVLCIGTKANIIFACLNTMQEMLLPPHIVLVSNVTRTNMIFLVCIQGKEAFTSSYCSCAFLLNKYYLSCLYSMQRGFYLLILF